MPGRDSDAKKNGPRPQHKQRQHFGSRDSLRKQGGARTGLKNGGKTDVDAGLVESKKRPLTDDRKEEDKGHSSSELELAKKRPKFMTLTLDSFKGDVAAWFEALHEHADPTLSKLERGTLSKPINFVNGSFLKVIKKHAWKKDIPEKGEGPTALVISSSADRSCVIAKEAHKFPGALAKLFARHMKVSEQQEFLNNNTVGVGLGTPNRLLKLCEDGILRLDKLKVLVIDLQQDSKTFSVLTMPEVARDFFKFFRQFVNTLGQKVHIVIVNPVTGEDDGKEEKATKADSKAKTKAKKKMNQPETTEDVANAETTGTTDSAQKVKDMSGEVSDAQEES